MQMIAVDDVALFPGRGQVHARSSRADGEALIRKPIKELYEELDPEAFWQIHRGTIVSLRAIGRVDRDWRGRAGDRAQGRDEKLTVSRTFAHRFKAM